MNNDHILFHLKEASEQLQESIASLELNSDYDFGEFVVDMSHLYHHINTAWNAREASEATLDECSESDFHQWRKMPADEELLLES